MPAGFMLAACSLEVHGRSNVPTDRVAQYLGHAVGLAAKAVSTDPDNVKAHVRLATAIGRHAGAIGSFEALNRGHGTNAREAAERALAPEMADARLAMGRRHALSDRRLGSIVAGMLDDASEDAALGHFQRILELPPDSKTIVLECAIGLLVLDEGSEHQRNLLVRRHRHG